MFAKLEEVVDRFREVEGLLSTPAVTANQEKFRALTREHAELAEVVEKYGQYSKTGEEIEGNRELLRDADPEVREMARAELPELETRRERLAQELKPAAAAQGSQRRQKYHPGDPRRHRRGGGGPVRRRSVPHVLPLCRTAALAGGSDERRRIGQRRVQGNHRPDQRRQGLLAAEVRERRPSGAAGAGNRGPGAHPYLRLHGGRSPRGRGCRPGDRSLRPAHRRLSRLRRRRPARQQDRIGGPHHPPADRRRRRLPGREVPAQEQGQGDEDPQVADSRQHAGRAAGAESPPTARARSGAATAANASAPTTSPRGAAPTTASA